MSEASAVCQCLLATLAINIDGLSAPYQVTQCLLLYLQGEKKKKKIYS